jgi:hypothetical protein
VQFWDSPLLPPHSAIFGIQSQPAGESNENFVRGSRLALISPLVTALDGVQLTACSARADAAAPSGGMAVVTAAWGMPAAVMVQVRVRASNYLLKGKATPASDHSFPFTFSPSSREPDVAGLSLAIAGAFDVKGQPVTFSDIVRIDAG